MKSFSMNPYLLTHLLTLFDNGLLQRLSIINSLQKHSESANLRQGGYIQVHIQVQQS